MNDNANKKDLTELLHAFNEIQMPRAPFALRHMVVNSKFTDQQRYAQCVLELSIAYDNLRLAKLQMEKKQIEIDEITSNDRKAQIDKEVKIIEKEQTARAVLGAMREFESLYEIWQEFPVKFTREQIDSAQETEYTLRLETQSNQDLNATGRVGQGNQEGLRQIGRSIYPSLDVSRAVEDRFLKGGNIKILIGIPTENKAVNGIPCITGLSTPNGSQVKLYNSWGRPVDESYNHIIQTALEDKADFIVTIEDDTFPPTDALIRLFDLAKKNPKCAIGAWYPKKEKSMQGVHIILKDGIRQQLDADDNIHEVYTLAMGCSIYPIEMFLKIPYPWFKTTANLSQDSFFSQLAREQGFKLLVDTSIRCKHIDRASGKIYELKGLPDAMQIPSELAFFLQKAANKKLILEIGTATGGTLSRLIKVAADDAEFISIDLPKGKYGGEFGQPPVEVMRSWLRGSQKLNVIRDDSKSILTIEKVKEILAGRKLDLIFIDGDHSYEGVKGDFEIYKQFAKDLVVFHDIAEHNREDVGVRKLWLEIEGIKTECIENENQGWAGIGILQLNDS